MFHRDEDFILFMWFGGIGSPSRFSGTAGSRLIRLFRKEITVPLRQAALFIDLDGTLAPIVARPEMVVPEVRRNDLVRRVARQLQGRLAVISGRSINDVDRILGGSIASVAGWHGLERRSSAGFWERTTPHPGLEKALPVVQAFAAARPELLVEYKTLSIAIHYRQAPEAAADVLDFARRLAWSTGLKLQQGRMVAELRSPGPDKGDTVRAFMAETLFAGHMPIFVGDDITDEDGFAAVDEMDGVGVLVGERRETRAHARLADVPEVLGWLARASHLGAFDLAILP